MGTEELATTPTHRKNKMSEEPTELREESASKPFESVGDQVDKLVKNLVDTNDEEDTEPLTFFDR